jgi:PAS domain S-box-containing protein
MSSLRVPLIAALVFVAGLAATLGVAHAIRQDAVADAGRVVAVRADEGARQLSQQLWTYGIALRGGASFFNGSTAIDRRDWQAYVQKLQVTEHLPGVQGFGFVEWIPPGRLAAHEARVRAEGFPDYRVHPALPRQGQSAILYLEPFAGRNLRAFGFNMYAETVRRTAMDQARDSGLGAMSGKVRLVQEDGRDEQAGFLMYVPVYRAGAPTDTVAERRAALVGWVYSPFRMRDMLEAAFRDVKGDLGKDFYLAVYDGGAARPEALMFDNTPADLARSGALLRQQRLLEFRGQRWLLVFSQPQAPAGGERLAVLLALAGGGVIALLLGGLVYVLGRTRERAQRLAEGMTADLRASAERLRASEEKTRELEYRWKFALEGSDLGVWDWNVATGEVWFSPRWKEMLGYEEHEIQGRLSEWESRVHPEDKPGVMRDVQAALEGRVRLYLNEHRVRGKDGSYRWILDRGMVVARAADGAPLRMLGTHADVTHTHEARARIRRLDRLYAALSACNGAIVRAGSEAELFAEVCQAIVNSGTVQMAWVGRIDPVLRRVQPVEAYGHGTEYLAGIEVSTDAGNPLGQGPTGAAARENRAVWSPDYARNPALAPWHARGADYGWVGSGALPLRRGGEPVAVLSLYTSAEGRLDEESRALLEEMVSDLSFALDRFAAEAEARAAQAAREQEARRYARQLVDLLQEAVALAADNGAARLPAGHERRAAAIAEAIGRELGLEGARLEGLRLGGALHDIGNLRLPAALLAAPATLSDAEHQRMQEHARLGHDLLRAVDFPWPVAQVALQHHERWDGSGYPQGLAGEAILLEARIVAVADVIESMASHRPYRPAIGLGAALAEVEAGSGSRYDPAVAAACLRLFRDKGFQVAA